MPAKKQPDLSYRELSSELDEVMSRLQADDVDVDTAIELYEKGMALVGQLTEYLQDRENHLIRLSKTED
jgi:exodeoxyribonuclease VII small subunit